MKYGFINKAIHSLISCFNTTPTANSFRELAFVVCENQSTKKANIARKAIAPVLVAGAMFTANEAKGQNSATIDPKYYSINNPYEVPNLPNGSTMNIVIKTGASVNSIISGADTGSLRIFTPDGRSLFNVSNFDINTPGTRTLTYTENGAERATGIIVNYQADIYGPDGDRPDAVIIEPGQTARLSGGPNMNPTGDLITGGRYARKNLESGEIIGNSGIDSTKNVSRGTYAIATNDGTGYWTMDTIAVIERPVANNNARTLAFATTVPGVIYKVYKASTASTDTTWTEEPSLSFVGDGNPANVNTGLGIFRIGAMRRAGDDIVEAQDTKSITVDLGTDMYEVTDKKPSFTVNNGVVRRTENVEYYIYDISGKIIDSGYGMDGQIKAPGVYIVKSKKDGGQRETNKAMAR